MSRKLAPDLSGRGRDDPPDPPTGRFEYHPVVDWMNYLKEESYRQCQGSKLALQQRPSGPPQLLAPILSIKSPHREKYFADLVAEAILPRIGKRSYDSPMARSPSERGHYVYGLLKYIASRVSLV